MESHEDHAPLLSDYISTNSDAKPNSIHHFARNSIDFSYYLEFPYPWKAIVLLMISTILSTVTYSAINAILALYFSDVREIYEKK